MNAAAEWGEPAPVPNDKPSIHDLVIRDMESRKAFGLAKYGTILQAGNGRKALKDAYEEVLDLAVYLRQELEERNEREAAEVRIGLCANRGEHDPHLVTEGSLAPFYCSADQTQREPYRSEHKRQQD